MPTSFQPCGYAFQGLGYVFQSLKCLFQALEQRITCTCCLFIACEEELSGLHKTIFPFVSNTVLLLLLVPQCLRRRDAADAAGGHIDANQHHGQQKQQNQT